MSRWMLSSLTFRPSRNIGWMTQSTQNSDPSGRCSGASTDVARPALISASKRAKASVPTNGPRIRSVRRRPTASSRANPVRATKVSLTHSITPSRLSTAIALSV